MKAEMTDQPQEQMTDAQIEKPANSDISPRPGTLAWLQQQPEVEVLGLKLPAGHRIPEEAELAPLDGDGHCRVITPERGRCRAPATKVYGICLAHLGGGAMHDPVASAHRATAGKTRLRLQRQMLGIGPSRTGNPRQHARLRALDRAQQLAEALVDGPLDADLGPLERQRAALLALDATFPIQTTQVEVELPVDGEGVQALSWEQMQALAARLLDE